MQLKSVLLLLMILSQSVWAQSSIEIKKASTIHDLIGGCAQSLIAPRLNEFMERAKAAGKPFPDEQSARKALEQKQIEMQKSEFYKNELNPAAKATCQCILETNIAKIKSAKSQGEIEGILKNLKLEANPKMQQCAEKHLVSALKKMK